MDLSELSVRELTAVGDVLLSAMLAAPTAFEALKPFYDRVNEARVVAGVTDRCVELVRSTTREEN